MGYICKGVSPILASVLLIAFSIAIATVVGTWAMNYTQKELSAIETQEYCNRVAIQQLDFRYDASSKEGVVRLQNNGEKIGGYRIYAFNSETQELAKEYALEIAKGDIKTFSFQTTLSGVTEVMVEVLNCPMVKLRMTV